MNNEPSQIRHILNVSKPLISNKSVFQNHIKVKLDLVGRHLLHMLGHESQLLHKRCIKLVNRKFERYDLSKIVDSVRIDMVGEVNK